MSEAGFEFCVKNYPVSYVQTIISRIFDFLAPWGPGTGPGGGPPPSPRVPQGPGIPVICRCIYIPGALRGTLGSAGGLGLWLSSFV